MWIPHRLIEIQIVCNSDIEKARYLSFRTAKMVYESMIWFDLDNSPHVPLFRPILHEMERRNIEYLVTARDFAQTKELLEFWQIQHSLIGTHGGKNKVAKVANLLKRSFQLWKFIRTLRPSLAVSQTSRTQLIAATRLRIPSVLMTDYEYTESRIFNAFASYILIPVHIPDRRLLDAGFNLKKVIRYTGFKEEVYLADFVPDSEFRHQLRVDRDAILVTIRPPSTVGNYHDKLSEKLFQESLEYFSDDERTYCLIVNRTKAELNIIPEFLRNRRNISILSKPVDGLQLIWHSDIVVSGGGTMNRESALLGVPTFSIFTGKRPFLDEYLEQRGKLAFVDCVDKIRGIPITKRKIDDKYIPTNRGLAEQIADLILDLSSRPYPR